MAQRKLRDLDTSHEIDFLEYAFKRHATRQVKEVLDIACGGGRHVVGLASRGYTCTGYDFSPERIKAARARAERAKVSVKLEVGDAARIGIKEAFDAVLGLYVLFLLPDDESVLRSIRGARKSLRSGGILVCNIFNPFTRGTNWVANAMKNKVSVTEQRAQGIRITEIQQTRDYDPVKGVVWVDWTTIIEALDGRHVFRDRERARLFTCWDAERYLASTGFRNIESYPDWMVKPPRKPKAEQVVFVARSP
jgi:SAM-dependent methyltransferase